MPFVTSADFGGEITQPEVSAFICNALLTGAPFARSLTVYNTSRGSVVFPVASPTAFDWVAEAGTIPQVDPGDATHIRARASSPASCT